MRPRQIRRRAVIAVAAAFFVGLFFGAGTSKADPDHLSVDYTPTRGAVIA